ncbi:MAG: tetratricopeptide repeat protein [Verrucomicrobiales bacterium]
MIKIALVLLLFCSVLANAETSAEFLAKAVSLTKEGKLAEAEAYSTKAIEADASNWQAYYTRALVRSRLGQSQKSAEDLTKLIEHDPQQSNLYQLRGMERFRNAEVDKAISDFDAFIKKNPSEEPHHWQRGIAYYYAGRYLDGKKQFELHQTVNKNDVENAVWHFICSAKIDGFEKAQKNLISITGDRRVPMAQVQELFSGKGSPEAVMAAANAEVTSKTEKKSRLFFAHLYLGLFFESKRDAAQAKEHIGHAATTYSQNHYMGDVAKVHWKLAFAEKSK